jgi:hypothetical protein
MKVEQDQKKIERRGLRRKRRRIRIRSRILNRRIRIGRIVRKNLWAQESTRGRGRASNHGYGRETT